MLRGPPLIASTPTFAKIAVRAANDAEISPSLAMT
jgi:hypothetical protein